MTFKGPFQPKLFYDCMILTWLRVTELVFRRREAVSKARLNNVLCLKLGALTWACVLGLDRVLPPLVPAVPPQCCPETFTRQRLHQVYLRVRDPGNALILLSSANSVGKRGSQRRVCVRRHSVTSPLCRCAAYVPGRAG